MVVVVTRQVLVIHRVVGIFQLDVARHVAVVVLVVADAVAGHHHLLLVALGPAATGRRSAAAGPVILAALLAVRRLILRPVFSVLLDPFVLRPPILEPNFDLAGQKRIQKCGSEG